MAELANQTEGNVAGEMPGAVPRMVTVDELAKLTHISAYAIRKLVRANKITYFKSGSKVLINFDRFIDFLNGER